MTSEVINDNNESGLFQLEYSNRLGEFNEMILCFDGKGVLQIQQDRSNNLVGCNLRYVNLPYTVSIWSGDVEKIRGLI